MKRNLKRIIAVFLAVVMSLASAAVVFADAPDPADYDEVIAIVHTNDVHGEIEVEPYVKGLADQLKASGQYSLVLTASAGDVYSGGKAVAGYYKGELIPAIMDQVYDVIAPGNNDFNEGSNTVAQNLLLTALYKHAKTICANLVFKNGIDLPAYASAYTAAIGNADFADLYDGVKLNGEALDFSDLNLQATVAETSPYKATEVFETAKGTKLGLFGLSCTEGQMTGKLVGPGSIEAAQNAVASLKTQNADVIVGLAHTGWAGENTDEATSANDTNSWYLASQVQDMDALIDSHTHSIINEGKGCYVGDNKVLVNQAGAYGNCIGVMKFYLKDHKVVAKTAELLTGDAVKAITPDETVQAMVDADIERVMEDVGPTLVTTPYFLNAEKASIRGRETNMGDFILDVVRNAASEKMGKDYVFASYPGFCFRTSIEANTMMTKMDIISILGYVTPIIEKEFTAQDIVDQVTWTLKAVHGSNASFYQYSGLTITYTTEPGEGSKIVGTPVTIKAGNTLIYDANKGGIQVPSSWKALGVVMSDPNPGTPNNFDIATVDPDKIICLDTKEDRALYPFVCDYLATHELGKDYVIYPDTVSPGGRIIETGYEQVQALIDAIGEVTLEKEAAIAAAREAYDALTEGDKTEMDPIYPITLLSAEVKLGKLKAEKAEGDAAAAAEAALQLQELKDTAIGIVYLYVEANEGKADANAMKIVALEAVNDINAAADADEIAVIGQKAIADIDALVKAAEDAAAQELADEKAAATAVVALVKADDYIETDQATVTKAIADAQAAIDAATSKDEIAAAIAALNEALAGCKTKRADAREKAAELAKAKKAAAVEINDYVEKNIAKIAEADRVTVELAALKNILKINNLENLESIHLGVDAVKALVDKYVKINTDTKAAQAYKVTGLKASSKSRKITVSWKKNAKAQGYEVQYKVKGGSFKKLKTTTGTKVAKKLKKGKTYTFQVRTYKTVNGKKVFGKWAKTKAVKCK